MGERGFLGRKLTLHFFMQRLHEILFKCFDEQNELLKEEEREEGDLIGLGDGARG